MEPTVETTTTPDVVTTPEPAAAPPAEAPSIADHAEAFSPDHKGESAEDRAERIERARDDAGRFAREPRHRAQSQRATSEDVPRIKELTKKWRTEETERKALAEKYAALEKEVQTLKAPKPVPPPTAPKPFEAKEPTFEQFQNDPDPLLALTRETARYQVEKSAADKAQEQYRAAQTEAEQHALAAKQAAFDRSMATYHERLTTFVKAKPDFETVIKNAAPGMTPLLQEALLRDERGPEFVYTLAQRPELLAEALLVSDGRASTDDTVAHMQRFLSARMPVATSGSTASPHRPYVPPAAPPNPERTGPIKTNEPPGEGSSIAEHSRYYAYKPKH